MRPILVLWVVLLAGCRARYPEAGSLLPSPPDPPAPDAAALPSDGGASASAVTALLRGKSEKGEKSENESAWTKGGAPGGVRAKRMALLGKGLRPLLGARRAGAMTGRDFEAGRLKLLGDLGFIPPERCASGGAPYACARSNLLPERLLPSVARLRRRSADPDEVLRVAAVLEEGTRVPFVYVTPSGEILKVFHDPGQCTGWSEGEGSPIPLDVSRITDVVPASAPLPPGPPVAPDGRMRRFDPVAAHAALDAVDASVCWLSGGVQGYGKVRVTFSPAGTVELVDASAVARNPPLSQCIAQAFGAATVLPFDGPSVTASATFYVAPAAEVATPGSIHALREWRPHAVPPTPFTGRSCFASARVTPGPPLEECAARGVSYPCARSNVLPPSLQAKLGRLPRSAGLPEQEVGAYGDAEPVPARPLRVSLVDGSTIGFVYVAGRGEIVKVFDDRDQTWWTEGDEKPIPFDVATIAQAAPSEP
jgi:hypothetical protein